jgi:hypothetical protein
LSDYTAVGTAGKKLAAAAEPDDLPNEPPTAGQVADAVWDEALSGHSTAGSAGASLAAAGAAGIAPGAIEFTYSVDDGDLPIEGAEVWFSSDAAGANLLWVGATDADGIARAANNSKPWFDPGTLYAWVKKSGFAFANPQAVVVSSD